MKLQSGVKWVLKMILGVLFGVVWLVGCLLTQGIVRILIFLSPKLYLVTFVVWKIIIPIATSLYSHQMPEEEIELFIKKIKSLQFELVENGIMDKSELFEEVDEFEKLKQQQGSQSSKKDQ